MKTGFKMFVSNTPIHLTLLCFLLLVMIISILCRKNNSLQTWWAKNKSFLHIDFVVILLLAFSVYVVSYIKNNYDRYASIPNDGISAIEFSLVDMQANTLAICALVVTLASIILTILTIYKEKRQSSTTKFLRKT